MARLRASEGEQRAAMISTSSPSAGPARGRCRHRLQTSALAQVQDHQDNHDVQHAGDGKERGEPVEQPARYWLAVIAMRPLAPMWIIRRRWRYVGVAVKCGWYVAAVRCGRLVARTA